MVLMVSISNDGKLAAKVTADGKFLLVDVPARTVIWKRDIKDQCVESVAVDSSGRYLAYPVGCGKVIVEEIVTGKRAEYKSPSVNRGFHSIAVGAGGYPLAFGACGRAIYVVRSAGEVPATFHPLGQCENLDFDAVHSLAFSRDSRLLATGWGTWLDRWKTTPAERTRPGWEDPGRGNGVGITAWSVETGAVVAELPGVMAGSSAEFSPSNDSMVMSGAEFALWETNRGKRVLELEKPALDNPQFVQDGALIVGYIPFAHTSDPRIYVLSVETGKVVATADTSSKDIMTRGHSAASASDKFLVAHRTGQVDVYQVSKDGHQIEKVWEF
jgi:WD40 repeat protein